MDLDSVARNYAMTAPLALRRRQLRLGQRIGPVAAEAAVLAVAGEDREPVALVLGVGVEVDVAQVHLGGLGRKREDPRVLACRRRYVAWRLWPVALADPLRCCRPCGRNRQPERNASSRTHRVRPSQHKG